MTVCHATKKIPVAESVAGIYLKCICYKLLVRGCQWSGAVVGQG